MDNGFINMPRFDQSMASLEELPGTFYYLPQVKRWCTLCPVLEIKYEPMQFLRFLKSLRRSDFDSTQLKNRNPYLKWQAPKLKMKHDITHGRNYLSFTRETSKTSSRHS